MQWHNHQKQHESTAMDKLLVSSIEIGEKFTNINSILQFLNGIDNIYILSAPVFPYFAL